MKSIPLLLSTFLLLFVSYSWAQTPLPIIRANSEMVDIRVNEEYRANAWTIAPEYKPDVFDTNAEDGWVVFYTDLDSISFQAKKGEEFNFIILLNNKDTAYTQIKYRPSRLEELKAASEYNYADQAPIPAFTYQSAEDPNLVAIRQKFKLDSIAGGGNDISKVLNLMHWVHNVIPHDGNNPIPKVKNALQLYEACENEDRGLHCRGLAIVLNECYLAMGFKSRFVTCMPKDSVFQDCHVINMVFLPELDKWIWLDPTNDAYLMDERGQLLSIAEVRERLINNQMLILNPDANWNRQFSTLKSFYIDEYMAKNLYRFSCPIDSKYDYETPEPGRKTQYIELLPLDGEQQEPRISERNTKSGVTRSTYKTNNPDLFWTKPRMEEE